MALARCTCSSAPEPIALDEVQPGQGSIDTATPITIVGSGFYPLVVVDYQSSSRSTIDLQFEARLGPHPLEHVMRVDDQHLTARVPAGLPLGTHELILDSPQGQRVQLANAFTVTAHVVVDGSALDAVDRDRLGVDLVVTDTLSLDRPGVDGAPDTSLPDAWPADAAGPDTWAPDTSAPDTWAPDAACVRAPEWWNAAYGHRRPLMISETISGSLLAGYSTVATIDTAALISGGKLLASGNDLRVVRTVGSSHQELDRHVVGLDTATTQVWFKTQADIDTSDVSYLLYYGNPAAGAPPAHWSDSLGADATPSAVYLAADDFENDTIGQAPNGWEGAGDYTVQSDSGNQVLRVVGGGGGNADYFFAGDYAWTDVVVQGRLRVVTTAGTYYGLFARVEDTTPFDTLWWGLYTNNTLQLYTLVIADPQAQALSSGTSRRTTNISNAGTTWHTLEQRLVGRSVSLWYDGSERTSWSWTTNTMLAGRIGLCAGYDVSSAYWDDIVVRRHVSPEPAVTVDAEEAVCP